VDQRNFSPPLSSKRNRLVGSPQAAGDFFQHFKVLQKTQKKIKKSLKKITKK
jgi:hypothetical protein